MRTVLGSLWSEPRPPGAGATNRRDLFVLALIPVAVLEGALRVDLPDRWAQVALLVVVLPALVWRRRRPLATLAAAVLPGLVFTWVTGTSLELGTSVAFLLLPYSLARWGSGREAVLGFVALLAWQTVALAAEGLSSDTVGGLVVLGAAGAVGAAVRFRARSRVRTLEQVRLLERERLARDLHDTVAHHVSTIAVRAQVGQTIAQTRPEEAAAELALIEAEARRTLEEMRGLVKVLRRTDPDDLTRPGLGDLERLASSDASGLSVRVRTDPLDEVAAPVVAALVRLAQESVTNARRHARRATLVEVDVRVNAEQVHLRVHDDGEGSGPRAAGKDGWGLVGMRERASLLGGSCAAGRDPDGGWTVTAVLPRRWPT
ncbi:sensor histidine kinase [Actinotalea sp. C106]|uniref:sensor histidine kinase n=1 Tax=Actinotalea sp. C106 TaxID=2908644 RepID=UPI0020290D08|nr:histidine kinase [Actinotalea sp. C106]